jgi:hypothetical protein
MDVTGNLHTGRGASATTVCLVAPGDVALERVVPARRA